MKMFRPYTKQPTCELCSKATIRKPTTGPDLTLLSPFYSTKRLSNFITCVHLAELHIQSRFNHLDFHINQELHNRNCHHGFFPHDATAPVGDSLRIIEASRSRSDTPHSVGLLWTSDQPEAETLPEKIHYLQQTWNPCPRWNSNRDPSKRAAANSCFRPRGHPNRPSTIIRVIKSKNTRQS